MLGAQRPPLTIVPLNRHGEQRRMGRPDAGGRCTHTMSQAEELGSSLSRRRRRRRRTGIGRRDGGRKVEREAPTKGEGIDLTLLEQRVRQELQRLLGREVRDGSRSDDGPKVDLELLEDRLRQVLHRLLVGGDGSRLDREGLPPELDLDLVERRMRSILRSRIARSIDERGLGSRLDGFDMVILGQRVREEISRALDGQAPDSARERARLPAFDRDLIEIRVKQELARRIPRLRELGWGGRSLEAPAAPLDTSLVAGRTRKAIRRALLEYRDRSGPRLTDDDIDRLVARVVDGS